MSRLKSVENEFKGIKQELSQKRKRKHTMSGTLKEASDDEEIDMEQVTPSRMGN